MVSEIADREVRVPVRAPTVRDRLVREGAEFVASLQGHKQARQRTSGELMEGLLEKLAADIAMMHPMAFSTLFSSRSNPAETLHRAGIPSSYQLWKKKGSGHGNDHL